MNREKIRAIFGECSESEFPRKSLLFARNQANHHRCFFLKRIFANYRRTKGDRDLKSMCNRIYIFTGIFIFWSQVSTPFGSPVICKIRFKKKHRWRFAGFRANASEFAQFRANFFAIHTAVYSLYLNIYHWIANIVGDIVALGYILCLIKNPNIKKN